MGTGFKYQNLLPIFLAFFLVSAKSDLNQNDKDGEEARNGCNLFQGQWLYNSSLNVLYDSTNCPFIGSYDCLKFGRTDKKYLQYSWKPTSCDLPRYAFTLKYCNLEFFKRAEMR